MICNAISFRNTSAFDTAKLRNKKTGEIETAEEVDKKIYKKHMMIGPIVGAVLGFIFALNKSHKDDILQNNVAKKIIYPLLGAGFFAMLGHFDITMDKFNKKTGMTTPSDKIYQYQNRGYEVLYKPDKRNIKELLPSLIGALIGAGLAVYSGISGKKIPLLMQWGYSNSQKLNTLFNGLGNALVYGVAGQVLSSVVNYVKSKKATQTVNSASS